MDSFRVLPGVLPHSTASVQMMVAAGQANGLAETLMLDGTGISSEELADKDTLIWPDQEFVVARNLLARLGDRPGLGAQTAQQATIGKGGLVILAGLVSKTVGDILALATRYQELLSVVARYTWEDRGDEFAMVVHGDGLPEDVCLFFIEREIASVLGARELMNLELPVLGIEMQIDADRGKRLSCIAPFDRYRMAFERPRNLILFPRTFLNQPMPHADAGTAAALERQCQEALRELQETGRSLTATVRQRLLNRREQMPSMTEVAAELHMTVRTLRRRLTAEGATFRGLLNNVREIKAAELLRTTATVEDVARQLGYAETANFTRAFTRWHGVSPSAYRRSAPCEQSDG
jgi:AraC-like DNA-binding protein